MKKAQTQVMMFAVLLLGTHLVFMIITHENSFSSAENINNMLTDAVIPAVFVLGMGILLNGSVPLYRYGRV